LHQPQFDPNSRLPLQFPTGTPILGPIGEMGTTMRLALAVIASFGFGAGASANDSDGPENLTRAPQGAFAAHSISTSIESPNFQCHKDHAGLNLEPAETLEDAEARLAAAVKDGGSLVVVTVKDLDCAFCAAAIEDAFADREEVAAAYVNIRDQSVSIVVRQDEDLSDKTIRKIIKRRGIGVVAIDRNAAPD
jgi:hypothetical protein